MRSAMFTPESLLWKEPELEKESALLEEASESHAVDTSMRRGTTLSFRNLEESGGS